MSLRHEHNNGAGGGGGGQQYELVTEEVNGIARSFDKLVLDHSLHNVAYMGSFNDELEAIQALTEVDEMYSPQYGQYLGWQDFTGNAILSRCSYDPNWTLPVSATWIDGAYDESHGTICVICAGENGKYEGDEGTFLVCTRKIRGPWSVRRIDTYERWLGVTYGNGMLVALTGNSSREYAISRDGGFTWTVGALSSHRQMKKCRFVDGKFYIIDQNGYLTTEDFETFSDFENVTGLLDVCEDSGGVVLFTYRSSRYYTIDRRIYGGTNSTVYDNGGDAKLYLDELYYFRDNYFLATSRGRAKVAGSNTSPISMLVRDNGNGTVYIDSSAWYRLNDGETLVQSIPYIRPNYFQNRQLQSFVSIYKDGEVKIIFKYYDTQNNFSSFLTWKSMSGDVQPTYLVPCYVPYVDRAETDEQQCMFYFGGGVLTLGGVKNKSTFGYMDYVMSTDVGYHAGMYFPANPWERIPLPNEFQDGIISVKDGEAKETTVERPYLEYKDLTLKANTSDRYEPYKNHRLSIVYEGELIEIWCIADWENIVDNTTLVYSDEECTIPVGVITDHNYNINNPYDTAVSLDGHSYVFQWDPLYYPEALATSHALIDGLEKKKGSVILGNAVYFKANGTGAWVAVAVTWNTDHYESEPATYPGFIVAVTTDGNEPDANLSNVFSTIVWQAGVGFGMVITVPFTSDNYGDSYINITV